MNWEKYCTLFACVGAPFGFFGATGLLDAWLYRDQIGFAFPGVALGIVFHFFINISACFLAESFFTLFSIGLSPSNPPSFNCALSLFWSCLCWPWILSCCHLVGRSRNMDLAFLAIGRLCAYTTGFGHAHLGCDPCVICDTQR